MGQITLYEFPNTRDQIDIAGFARDDAQSRKCAHDPQIALDAKNRIGRAK